MKAELFGLLFPPKCSACGILLRFKGFGVGEPPALCTKCRNLWESEKLASCGGCGKAVSVCTCLTEELSKAHCEEFCKPVYYLPQKPGSVQNRLIYRLKNMPDRRAVRFLAQELEQPVREMLSRAGLKPEHAALVYIPRGRGAVLQTGTDQAKRLAYALSERLKVPVIPAVSRKRGQEKPQKKFGPRERRQNAQRSYQLNRQAEIGDRAVILVDDIVTTGSSMAACARLLRKNGVKRIFCAAVASDDRNQNAGVRQPVFHV